MSLTAKDCALCAMFAALLAVCSWISVPAVVPISMQSFAVFVTMGLLGGRRAAVAILVYILMGATGLPVFAGFRGGAGVLLGATGGYIMGFIASALLAQVILRRENSDAALLAAMLAGLALCYAFGTVWFALVYTQTSGKVGFATVFGWCVLPFIIPDVIKALLACALCKRLRSFASVRRLLS